MADLNALYDQSWALINRLRETRYVRVHLPKAAAALADNQPYRSNVVFANGRLYDRTALDGLLADVARAVDAPSRR